MKLLITGGTGFLGGFVLKELENPIYKEKFSLEKIRLFVRSGKKAEKIKSKLYEFEIIEGSITDKEAVQKATEGIDSVLHIASKYSIHGKKKDFITTNVDGTANLLNALAPGSTFILTSSIAIYGYNANKGKPFTEDYEPKKPFWHYQVTKKMQEDLAREKCKEKGITFVALRPPMISGPGDEPTKIFIENLEKRRIVLCRGGNGFIPVVHPTDAAKAHLLALEKAAEVDGEAFHFSSFHVKFKDFANAFTKELGIKKIKMRVPYWFIYSFATVLEFLPFNTPYSRFAVKFLGGSDQLDNSKITEKLGYQPTFKLEETVKESVDWYKTLMSK